MLYFCIYRWSDFVSNAIRKLMWLLLLVSFEVVFFDAISRSLYYITLQKKSFILDEIVYVKCFIICHIFWKKKPKCRLFLYKKDLNLWQEMHRSMSKNEKKEVFEVSYSRNRAKYFTRQFHQVQTSYFWTVIVYIVSDLLSAFRSISSLLTVGLIHQLEK